MMTFRCLTTARAACIALTLGAAGLAVAALQASTYASAEPPGEGAPQAEQRIAIEVVVRFKDDRIVKDIADTFWKDRALAALKFEAFRRGRSEMANATLARVSYSNELILAFPCDAACRTQPGPAARALADRLARAADVAYAEPNVTFQPASP